MHIFKLRIKYYDVQFNLIASFSKNGPNPASFSLF